MNFKEKITKELNSIGIEVNGPNPKDIHIHNSNLFSLLLSKGTLGLGESYMDGWWDCERLDDFLSHCLSNSLNQKIRSVIDLFDILKVFLINSQNINRAKQVGQQHYDIGNFLYEKMLDPLMVYTCGYWKNASDLATAQKDKLDLIARKLELKSGMKVLDIGCGFGGAACFMAENYGVEVVGVTVSQEQYEYARKTYKDFPATFLLQDYRNLIPEYKEKFDRIYSIGMFEHVGYKNYKNYFQVANQCLKNEGLFLLHTIGSNGTVYKTDPWIERYIFPNGMLPSIRQIGKAIENLFVMEDWHNFGVDYDKTLMAWYHNFKTHWQEIKNHNPNKYNDRFYRMWEYYLMCSAASFRSRTNQLWQIVLSKQGKLAGYSSIR